MPSTRPQNPVQRDRCDRAHRKLLLINGLHAAVRAVLETDYIPARNDYYARTGGHAAIKARIVRTVGETHAAGAAFHNAFRGWIWTVTNSAGMHDAAELSSLFRGALPGEIPAMSYAEALNRTAHLKEALAEHPALGGDPVKLEALYAARAALEEAVDRREGVATDQTDSVEDLSELERQFDGSWGQVVRVVARRAPHLVNKIPVFHENAPSADDVILPDDVGTEEAADEAAAAGEPPKQDAAAGASGSPPPSEGAPGEGTSPPGAETNDL